MNPRGNGENTEISLMNIVAGLKERGIDMPVLLRFGDILRTQITRLNYDFGNAIATAVEEHPTSSRPRAECRGKASSRVPDRKDDR